MSRTDAIACAHEQLRSGAFLKELDRRVAYKTESQNAERGEEQAIESAALQDLREIEPIGQAIIFGRAVARMRPKPRRLMRHAVHGEGVEPDFLCHGKRISRIGPV